MPAEGAVAPPNNGAVVEVDDVPPNNPPAVDVVDGADVDEAGAFDVPPKSPVAPVGGTALAGEKNPDAAAGAPDAAPNSPPAPDDEEDAAVVGADADGAEGPPPNRLPPVAPPKKPPPAAGAVVPELRIAAETGPPNKLGVADGAAADAVEPDWPKKLKDG